MPQQYTSKQVARFYSHIQVMPNGCHDWKGATYQHGYGHLTVNKRGVAAHRMAWELVNGPIPDGMHACHTCDRLCCCNPEHIFIGTRKDNSQDMMHKGRENRTIRRRGEEHGISKLTMEEVIEIREMYATGNYTQKQLASMFHVSQTLLSRIVLRKIWKHV